MAEPAVIIVPTAMHHKAYRREVYHALAAFHRRPMNGEIAEVRWRIADDNYRAWNICEMNL